MISGPVIRFIKYNSVFITKSYYWETISHVFRTTNSLVFMIFNWLLPVFSQCSSYSAYFSVFLVWNIVFFPSCFLPCQFILFLLIILPKYFFVTILKSILSSCFTSIFNCLFLALWFIFTICVSFIQYHDNILNEYLSHINIILLCTHCVCVWGGC